MINRWNQRGSCFTFHFFRCFHGVFRSFWHDLQAFIHDLNLTSKGSSCRRNFNASYLPPPLKNPSIYIYCIMFCFSVSECLHFFSDDLSNLQRNSYPFWDHPFSPHGVRKRKFKRLWVQGTSGPSTIEKSLGLQYFQQWNDVIPRFPYVTSWGLVFLTYFEGPAIPSQQVFGMSSIVVVLNTFVAFLASYLREKIWFD